MKGPITHGFLPAIMVPVDRTSDAVQALPVAQTVAPATTAALHLLTLPTSKFHNAQGASLADLEHCAVASQTNGINADVMTRTGEPVATILQCACRAH